MNQGLNGAGSIEDSKVSYNNSQTEIREQEVYFDSSKSVCPVCLKVIDSQIFFRDHKVFMRKVCMEHGQFEILVYSDVDHYLNSLKFNKPGAEPLLYQGTVEKGCPEQRTAISTAQSALQILGVDTIYLSKKSKK
jgi:uncharacterized radical SAM superfamily Fe-S cluster-containing enzyme